MLTFAKISIMALFLTACGQREPDQVGIKEINDEFRVFDENRLEKIKKDALNGDRQSSNALIGYYLRYSSVDIYFAADNFVFWANNSLKLKDCSSINALHTAYTQGWHSGENLIDGKTVNQYAIPPSLGKAKFLEKVHAEWKCSDPLYPPGSDFNLDKLILNNPDLRKSQ